MLSQNKNVTSSVDDSYSSQVPSWNPEEANLLNGLVKQYCSNNKKEKPTAFTLKDWENIVTQFPGKKAEDCRLKWMLINKAPKYKKSPQWSIAEDELLQKLVQKLGSKRWQ